MVQGGYTITVESDSSTYSVSFCHISPNFKVSIGDYVVKGMNVYNVKNNPYKDSNGNPTNGATTGCHLHLTIKKDGIRINPLSLFKI